MSITDQDRERLIALARSSVAAAVSGRPVPAAADCDGILGEVRGCFVTLTNGGRLRGCIGTFAPPEPLGKMIVQMAAAAAASCRKSPPTRPGPPSSSYPTAAPAKQASPQTPGKTRTQRYTYSPPKSSGGSGTLGAMLLLAEACSS